MAIYREDSLGGLDPRHEIFREDSGGTLHSVRVYREDSSGNLHLVYSPYPHDLSITSVAEGTAPSCWTARLSWIPDSKENQEVWRCSGSGCDPVNDGVQLATLNPGVDSYDDTGLSENTTWNYAVRAADNQGFDAEDEIAFGPCPI